MCLQELQEATGCGTTLPANLTWGQNAPLTFLQYVSQPADSGRQGQGKCVPTNAY